MEGFRFNELEWLPYDRGYIKHVPDQRGLYFLSCPKGRVIYVGKASKSSSGVRTRLLTYGRPDCHNKWIRLYFRGKHLTFGAQPADLYFAYWLTNNPDFWEPIAILNSRLASGGLNQRIEWAPLFHPTDEYYRTIVRTIVDRLEGEERRSFEAWLRSKRYAP